MVTIALAFNLIGGYILYLTSQKKRETFSLLPVKVVQNTNIAKAVGLLFLGAAAWLLYGFFGLTSGLLFWFFTLCATWSLIIVLAPLNIVKYKWVALLIVLCLIVENCIY